MGQPCFINIDDPLARLQKGQHLLGVEHPGDQTPLGITLVGSPLEEPVAHIEVLTKDASHLFILDIRAAFFYQGFTDLLCPPNVPVSSDVRRHAVPNLLPAVHFELSFLLQLGDRIL